MEDERELYVEQQREDVTSIRHIVWPLLGILFSYTVLPGCIYSSSMMAAATTALAIYILFLYYIRIPEYILVMVAMTTIMPSVHGETASAMIKDQIYWIFLWMRVLIVSIFIINIYVRKKTIPFKSPIKFGILSISLGALYFFAFGDIKDLMTWIWDFIYVILFFYNCISERFSLKVFYFLYSALFLMISFYSITDYFFHFTPYSLLYNIHDLELQSSANEVFRARGLTGHPLLLSAQAGLYIGIILFKFTINREYDLFMIVMVLLALFVSLLTASKTSLLVIAGELLYFIYLSAKTKQTMHMIAMSFIIILIAAVTSDYWSSQYDNFIFRLYNSGTEHREAAYSSVANLFYDNPFGVGIDNINSEIKRYATYGLIKDFTLDNFFLRQIAAYGVFAVITCAFYYFYLHTAYLLRRSYPSLFFMLMLFALIWTFTGISFNLETFISLKTPFFAIVGFIYSIYLSYDDDDDMEFAESSADEGEYFMEDYHPDYIEESSDNDYSD